MSVSRSLKSLTLYSPIFLRSTAMVDLFCYELWSYNLPSVYACISLSLSFSLLRFAYMICNLNLQDRLRFEDPLSIHRPSLANSGTCWRCFRKSESWCINFWILILGIWYCGRVFKHPAFDHGQSHPEQLLCDQSFLIMGIQPHSCTTSDYL